MKTNLLLLIYFLLSANLYAQTAFEGTWKGAFNREGSVQLTEFTISTNGDSLTGYHDIPERELYHEPLENISLKDDTLFFRSRYGPFWVIKDSNPEQLLGKSVRWNPKIKLHLKKVIPQKNYFSTHDFTTKNGWVTISGKVYEPINQSPENILIVLVHGSGPAVMDDRYYRTEALALVKRGFHVAVYDKRGNGLSSGSMQGSTLSDLADDAVSVLNTVQKRYNGQLSVGFMGISQGGWVSTIASTKTGEHDFLILNVGPAVSLFQQEIDRVRYTLQQNGYEDSIIKQAVSHTKLMFELVDDSSLWRRYIQSSKKIEELGLKEIVNTATNINDQHLFWWRANRYDPEEDLLKQTVPVLSLMGSSDPLVPPATNKDLMESLLEKSNAPYYKIVVFENAYHNLQIFGTLTGDNWDWPKSYWMWQHKAEGVYESINNFMGQLR